MSAIAVNFVQVFCFAVLFEQISCEQTQLQQANETLIIETINCAVFCLNENANDVNLLKIKYIFSISKT